MKNSIVASRRKATGFTLVEIMIVVLIIGILLAIAVPNFVKARESSRAKACVANLKQIDSADQQFAMDNKLSAANWTSSAPTLTAGSLLPSTSDTSGESGYIRALPVCPSGGAYAIPTSITGVPTCTISVSPTDTNYATGGVYYHGL
jgi:type II secretion system protein G